MPFIKNMWYVAAWSYELTAAAPIGRMIVGEPIVFYRKSDGSVVALEDRCPHRHAPLSLGRVNGDDIQCMYHGLVLGCDGVCKSVPGTDTLPPHTDVRTFPVAESSDWIWVWTGDPDKADVGQIPPATGLNNPHFAMQSSAMDYQANYELINDNLTDLSHLDFVHETTLGAATGRSFSRCTPRITSIENGLFISRWLEAEHNLPGRSNALESWSSYRYLLPGLFLLDIKMFPEGTAASLDYGDPPDDLVPVFEGREQQAVTPMTESTTRYLYATGIPAASTPEELEQRLGTVNAAFAEDKLMIEAQQRNWNVTPTDRQKAFLPQDKAPQMFRRLIARRLRQEQAA